MFTNDILTAAAEACIKNGDPRVIFSLSQISPSDVVLLGLIARYNATLKSLEAKNLSYQESSLLINNPSLQRFLMVNRPGAGFFQSSSEAQLPRLVIQLIAQALIAEDDPEELVARICQKLLPG